jgi:ADA HAT complex component 1
MALSQGIYRLLPWTSSLGGNKVMAEMLVTPNQHQSPMVLPPTLKRKRDDNHQLLAPPGEVPPTKRRLTNTDTVNVGDSNSTINPTPGQIPDDRHPSNSTSTGPNQTIPELTWSGADSQEAPQQDKHTPKPKNMEIDALRQSVDAQLSLEVLLKHDELRLIDQEIAKCQVALEQLRRCAEIPYPSSALTGLSQSVSNGVGHAIPYIGSGPPPTSPSPWGIVDGPYSRHYSKWLLPDPRFDGGEIPPAPMSNYGYSTRGTATDHGHLAGKSARAQRGSVSTRLQSLPTGYPPPKDKAGPMMIKRKSDNQLVKLVCIDCRRYDFSSTQGFINHCRIAHSRTFASHEAAAEACGESVDVDEAGAVAGGPPEPTPTSTAVPGYVHPLIRTAPAIDRTSKDNKSKQSTTPRNPPNQKSTAIGAAATGSPFRKRASGVSNSSFIASPAAPHLSSFLADIGSDLNLGEIVGDAKTTVDMSTYVSESESDDEDDGVTPVTEDRPLQGARLPARTTMPQAASQRPTSSKGHEAARSMNTSRNIATPSKTASYVSPYPPSLKTPGPLQLDGAHALDPMDIGENLSPHTVESNQAPSLVSDDEDEFEAASDSESLSLSSSEAGHEDEEIDDIEVEDDEGTATPTATEPKADVMTSLKRGHGKKGDRLLAPAIVSLNRGKEGRRVKFVKGPASSPSKSKKDPNSKQG